MRLLLRRIVLPSLSIAVAALAPEGAMNLAYGQTSSGEYGADETPDTAPGADDDSYADTDPTALTDFRSTLDPHGAWVDDPTYGELWVPNADEVGQDFAPYVSEGSWAYDDDYVWMSNYAWGWIPFHYGRWTWASGRWGWVPGRRYAGAWVTWRTGADGYGYVGWGPMAPSFGWRAGVAFGLGAQVASRAGPSVFVARSDLFAPGVSARVVVGDRLGGIGRETRPYGRAEALGSGQGTAPLVLRGPSPESLGIAPASVVRVDARNPIVARARAFARPSTATPLGAHAPVVPSTRRRRASGPATPAPRSQAAARGGPRR